MSRHPILTIITAFLLIIPLLLLSIAFATDGQVNSFFEQNNPFNITFTKNENHTYFIQFPSYAYVNNVSFGLTTYSLPTSSFLTGYWKFSENGNNEVYGGGSAIFVGDEGYDGNYPSYNISGNGTPFSKRQVNTTSYINLSNAIRDALEINNNTGISFWVNPNRTSSVNWLNGNQNRVMRVGTTTNIATDVMYLAFQLNVTASQGNIRFYMGVRKADGTITEYDNIYANMTDGWWHIVYTLNSTHLSSYFNSVKLYDLSYDGTIKHDVSNDLLLGGYGDTNYGLNGSIDEVKVYSETLSQDDVNSLYQYNVDAPPTNLYIEVGDIDGTREWNYTSLLYDTVNPSINISLLNSILANNCNCTDCSESANLCSIPFLFHSNTSGILQINLTNATYSYGLDNCSNSFAVPSNATSYIFKYYNQESGNPIQVDSSGILDYTGGRYSFKFLNQSNNSFCIYPSWYNPTGTIHIYYSKQGYATKIFNSPSISFTEDILYKNLYLFNSTSTQRGSLIVQIFDDFTNLITGANIKLQEYDSDTNSFIETAQCYSDTNGECIFDVELNTKFYIVTATATINNQVYLAQSTSTGQLIKLDGTVIEIHLKTTEEFKLDDLYDLVITPYNTSLVGNTSYLTAVFNDASNSNHTVCVGYYIKNGLNEAEQTSTCISGTSGTVNAVGGYILDRSDTWIAKIYVLNDDGPTRVYSQYIYDKISGTLLSDFALYLKPMILMALLSLLALALYLKNMGLFAIGEMILSPTTLIIYPNLFGGVTMSFLLILGGLILFFISRKSEAI